MMSPEAMRRWIADLRSGEYQQQVGKWVDDKKTPTAFCCLSVALKGIGQLDSALAGNMMFGVAATRLGLQYSEVIDLGRMNDLYGKNFNEIADYIEQVLLPKAEEKAAAVNRALTIQ